MIRVTVKNRDAMAVPLSPVTSGAVGLPVHFNFSDDWLQEGLTRIACFRVPEIDTIYSAILDETNDTVVPWELLVNHGRVLFIGAYAENAAGTLVIPTIWAEAGIIEMGTQDGESGTEPTPTQWTQIRELAEEAAASAEAAEGYAEHGPTIINGYWYTWDGEEYVTTGQAAQGPAGQDGSDGQDGVSPTVSVTSVTGGHAVTITDADHPSGQSFNVLDGTDGQDGQDGQDGAVGPPGIAVQDDAPTSNVLAWFDTDGGETKTLAEMSDLSPINTNIGNLKSDLAYVEEGNTATRNYASGDYICWKGLLHTASTTISSGATFAVGTNLTAVSEGGLNDLKNTIPFPQPNSENTKSSVDLDDFKTNGLYYMKGSLANSPSGNYGFLIVIASLNSVNAPVPRQFYFPNGNEDIWVRGFRSGAWSTWRQLTLT